MSSKYSGMLAAITIGWLVPLLLGVYFNFWTLPSIAPGGVPAAYEVLSKDGWPLVWLITWIALSGAIALLLARKGMRGGMTRGWVASLNVGLWCFVIVQTGSVVVSALVSSAINSLGPLGPVPGGLFWSAGMLLAGLALLLAIALSLKTRLSHDA